MEWLKYKVLRMKLKYLYYISQDMQAYDALYKKVKNNKHHAKHIDRLVKKAGDSN